MNEELVSIIIPAYNHEKYIEQTIETIIGQTYKNIELIILNDGSTDNTHRKIVEMDGRLKSRFTRYIYVNKINEGICRTLNKGLALSQGKYIIPFSSDDVMLPKRVEKQVEFFRTHNKDFGLVYSDGYIAFTQGPINLNCAYPSSQKFSNHLNFLEGYLFDWMLSAVFSMPTFTICIRRECYDVVGNYDENLTAEDPDMFIRIAKAFKIGYTKDIVAIKRYHNTNTVFRKEIMIPLLVDMKEKYKDSPILNSEQRTKLLGTLNGLLAHVTK